MALWKPFRGSRSDLDAVPKHDGYVYFCDDGALFFDYTDADSVLQRKQINAKEAERLLGYDIAKTLTDSDVEIPTSHAILTVLADYAKSTDIDTLEDYIDTQIATIPTPDVSGQINEHNAATTAHSDIRTAIEGLANAIGGLKFSLNEDGILTISTEEE